MVIYAYVQGAHGSAWEGSGLSCTKPPKLPGPPVASGPLAAGPGGSSAVWAPGGSILKIAFQTKKGPGGSTRKAHAAFSSGCGPYPTRMIHGASDCPIPNHGAFYRLLVGGPTEAWARARSARGSTREAAPHARHMRLRLRVDHNSRDSGRTTCQAQLYRQQQLGPVVTVTVTVTVHPTRACGHSACLGSGDAERARI